MESVGEIKQEFKTVSHMIWLFLSDLRSLKGECSLDPAQVEQGEKNGKHR
jgi:hypothetical protein